MALKKDFEDRHNETKAELKEKMEQTFNKTVDVVVAGKMFVLDLMGRSFNKTVDALMGAKEHLKDVKVVVHNKLVEAYSKTADLVEDFKQDVDDYKRAKAEENRQNSQPSTKIVFVARDFLDVPTINTQPTEPLPTLLSSKALDEKPTNSHSSPSVYIV